MRSMAILIIKRNSAGGSAVLGARTANGIIDDV
jgi:hypothetical protein